MGRSTRLLLLFLLASVVFAAAETTSGYFKTSDGVRLHYLEAGSGPAIVFVPGWSIPAWIWESQIHHFSAHYHVVALDPRSQADSEKTVIGPVIELQASESPLWTPVSFEI
ncbi:MAG: alpha/beta hydrolase [Terriglobales bacterium]